MSAPKAPLVRPSHNDATMAEGGTMVRRGMVPSTHTNRVWRRMRSIWVSWIWRASAW